MPALSVLVVPVEEVILIASNRVRQLTSSYNSDDKGSDASSGLLRYPNTLVTIHTHECTHSRFINSLPSAVHILGPMKL